MASGWSAGVAEAGVVLHKTVNKFRSNALSAVKNTTNCVKKFVGWIDKLIRYAPQLDYESRKLFEDLGEELEKLKSDANGVLQSFKVLAEVASDEHQIDHIKEEIKKRSGGSVKRAFLYVRNKISRNSKTSSELKVFLSSLHDHILICTDAVNVFYQHYELLSSHIKIVIDAKGDKLRELKKTVERSGIASGATTKVATTGWFSTVACAVVSVAAIGLTGGVATPIVGGLAAAGFMGVSGAVGSTISERALRISQKECNYLDDILNGIVGLKKEMNVIKTSIDKMDHSMNNVQDVLDGQLDHYTEQSFYRDAEREDIEASLDDLQDYMQHLIDDIESCEWQPY